MAQQRLACSTLSTEQTKRGTTQVYYDQRGNLTKDDSPAPGRAYLYNRQNMLTRVEDASSNLIASYAYDALNRRIEKTVTGSPDVTTRFYYTASWQLIEETDDAATPAVQRDYVWTQGDGSYIDNLLLMRDVIGTGGTANADYFACRHHNFNVVAMLDNTGAVVERYDYNPYGKRFILDSDYTADANGISDVGMNIGHQGLYHDGESGLVYVRNRYLNLLFDRWMQRDPLEYPDGLNAYVPYFIIMGGIDPTGLESIVPLSFWGIEGYNLEEQKEWQEHGFDNPISCAQYKHQKEKPVQPSPPPAPEHETDSLPKTSDVYPSNGNLPTIVVKIYGPTQCPQGKKLVLVYFTNVYKKLLIPPHLTLKTYGATPYNDPNIVPGNITPGVGGRRNSTPQVGRSGWFEVAQTARNVCVCQNASLVKSTNTLIESLSAKTETESYEYQ